MLISEVMRDALRCFTSSFTTILDGLKVRFSNNSFHTSIGLSNTNMISKKFVIASMIMVLV